MKKHLLLKYKYKLIVFAILTFAFVSFELFNTLILGEIINNVVDQNNALLKINLIRAIFIIIMTYFLYYVKRVYKVKLNKQIVQTLRYEVFRGILSQKESEFSQYNKGEYISQINNDLSAIENNYIDIVLELLQVISFFIIAVLALIRLNVIIAFVILILSLMPTLVTYFTKNRLDSARSEVSQKAQTLNDCIKQNLDGYYQIKQYNMLPRFIDKFSKVNTSYENSKFQFALLQGKVIVSSEIVGALVRLIPLSIGAILAIQGKILLGDIIIVNQLLGNVTRPVVIISTQYSNLKSMEAVNRKILKWLKVPLHKKNIYPIRFEKEIKFNSVNYSYQENSNALENINIKICKNEKVAIVGKSGSGKSTILRLITKSLEDYTGDIYIDFENLRKYNANDIFDLIAVISAKPYIFNDTLYNNITMYENFDEDEVEKIIKETHLDAVCQRIGLHESLISEDANSISSGEAQKISIARALIRKKKILICDEVTSALDVNNTNVIDELLLSLKDTTLIAITHKLNSKTLSKYNRVITLNEGKVINFGSNNGEETAL